MIPQSSLAIYGKRNFEGQKFAKIGVQTAHLRRAPLVYLKRRVKKENLLKL
jgi:hypothetical protein